MAFPGVIERPLLGDEISIYLDNTRPIPLSALATFLGKLDKEARSVEGMAGLFLELSDFALGSNELRLRVVGPGRIARDEVIRQERAVAAAEGSARTAKIGTGAAVVSAVAAVVAIAINTGSANPSAYKIVNSYDVTNIYVRAPSEPPHIVTRSAVEYGRHIRLTSRKHKSKIQLDQESYALSAAMEEKRLVDLAGWVRRDSQGTFTFETIIGNRLPVYFDHIRYLGRSPVAVRGIIHDSPHGLQLEIVEVLAELENY